MVHPAEVELPRTIEEMLKVVERVRPVRLVIDSMAEIRTLARDEAWYRRQLLALKQHFADKDCTVLLAEIPVEHQPTLNSIVSGVVELEQHAPVYGPDRRRLRVVKMRGQDFSSGYHDFKIRRGGIEVFPRVIAADHRGHQNQGRFGTGIAELDRMLGGGLVRGTSTLLLGPSGTGKSATTTQLAVAAADRGERVAMFVFDERVQTLLDRSHSLGMPLERYVREGMIEIRQIDPAEVTSGEFSHIVKVATEGGNRIDMLVIDSLNGYAYAMPQERLIGVHLHELASFLSQTGVSSVFTMTQHGLFDRFQQSFDVSYISDTVMLFRHFEFAGRVRKALSVYKMRSGPHETWIRELQFGAGGLTLGPPLRQFQGVLSGTPSYVGDKLQGFDDDGYDESESSGHV